MSKIDEKSNEGKEVYLIDFPTNPYSINGALIQESLNLFYGTY
jgi:hypothetical protein